MQAISFPSFPELARTGGLLAVGGVGGALAQAVHLPMPWMLGSLAITGLTVGATPDALLGNYRFPNRFRVFFVGLIGVMIGTQVTPELWALARNLPLTLVALALFVVAAHAANVVLFRRLGGYDRATAFYAGAPGGLMESLLMGERAGADLRVLTAQQFLRIIWVVSAVPLTLSLYYGRPVGSSGGDLGAAMAPVPAPMLALIAVVAVTGLLGAQRVRLPAAQITGPMLLAAALTVGAGLDLHLPFWLIATAQVVVGVSLGMRFRGITGAMLRRSVYLSGLSVTVMLVIGAGFSWALAKATGIGFLPLLISFAPGGVTEMSLIALSLAANPALVSLHHIARILMTVGVLAVAERWVARN